MPSKGSFPVCVPAYHIQIGNLGYRKKVLQYLLQDNSFASTILIYERFFVKDNKNGAFCEVPHSGKIIHDNFHSRMFFGAEEFIVLLIFYFSSVKSAIIL